MGGLGSKTRDAAAGFLPCELTSFVGRQREVDDVRRLLAAHRLVTLTGFGGTGKTRVAVRVARGVRHTFADGVWFIDLTQWRDMSPLSASASNLDTLAVVVGGMLGLRGGTVLSMEALAAHLATWNGLIMLDNCEHLIPAVAVFTDHLLRSGPDVRVLATSREPLLVEGEVVHVVPPLQLPARDDRVDAAELVRYESIVLFVERARAVHREFSVTAVNAAAVAGVCHRLEGLPLAIELAASWLPVLTPQQILERMSDRFALLHRAKRFVPARQQTLRACLDWSFELCSKPERLLWARLTVFVGGFETDAVVAICADDDLPAGELANLVVALADKSIIAREDVGGGSRYRMLETQHEYGRDQLHDAHAEELLRNEHCAFYENLVDRARAEWIGPRQKYWLARLSREHVNLRAVVGHCLADRARAPRAAKLIVALPVHYWWARGLFDEGRRWVDRVLALMPEPTTCKALAVLLASQWALAQGDVSVGISLLEEGEALATELGDPESLAFAAFIRGLSLMFSGQVQESTEVLSGALTTLMRSPNPNLDLRLHLLHCLAISAAMIGDHELAAACHGEMLACTEPVGEVFHRSAALWGSGLAAYVRRDLDATVHGITESLRLNRVAVLEDRYGTTMCLEVLGWVAGEQERPVREATLLGAASVLWQELGSPFASLQHLVGYHTVSDLRAREVLGATEYARASANGARMSYEEAIAFALEESGGNNSPTAVEGADDDPLTRREREVADLVAKGLANKEIAARLVVSVRTAEGHVTRILAKLGFTNRTQLTVWVSSRHQHRWP